MRNDERKHALARIAGRFGDGQLNRRDFLSHCGNLGLGFSAAALLGLPGLRRTIGPSMAAAAEPTENAATKKWLREVGGGHRGAVIRMVSENTPPSVVIANLTRTVFTPLTGIDVQIELLPLDRVLKRVSIDAANRTAQYDLVYLDQSWIALFGNDTVDPREKFKANGELAMPAYDWDDFLPSLMKGIATYQGKTVGVPFDIPILMMFYRRDLFDELGLSVPTTMDEYLSVVRTIQKAKAPEIYGTTGQMKAGHYSLNCEWTAWLWGHGGSIFDAGGYFSGGDADGMQGLHYMLELYRNMPPYAATWDWNGQVESLLEGLAGVTLAWSEFFPAADNPKRSLVPGLLGAAPPPRATHLRPPEECGFGEIPNVGHQGGSVLALSKYSQQQNAAWIFLQWATSSEVQTMATLLGGGATPTRASVFEDPRVKKEARVQAGTTRHFNAVRRTIETAMGSEPDFPAWPKISNGVIPRELGRLLTHDDVSPETAMAAIKIEADKLAEPYR
ncbi:MAG: extracellular solute-binding protein [Alphaproteobacteria bacterium]|nr:extracellular solute-binding protein [Alphaproteobacteria bacterium]